MNESKNWISHFVVLLTILLGSFYLLDGKVEIERQSNRTDHLYEMFLEVKKEIKNLYVITAVIENKIEENDR